MIEPKGRRYANTTERTMAAEKRIHRVVRGLLEQIDKIDDLLAPEHSLMEDRRVVPTAGGRDDLPMRLRRGGETSLAL
jgi:hypothetical protein